jgi:hypothetical protein
MKPGYCTVYIYYQAEAGISDAVIAAMRSHADALAPQGVSVAFSRRPEERSGIVTWMETFVVTSSANVHQISEQVEASARASGLANLARGGRVIEFFVPVEL